MKFYVNIKPPQNINDTAAKLQWCAYL